MYETRTNRSAWRCMRAVGFVLVLLAPLTSAATPVTPTKHGFASDPEPHNGEERSDTGLVNVREEVPNIGASVEPASSRPESDLVTRGSIQDPWAEPKARNAKPALRITVVPPVADAHLLPKWISQRNKGLIDRLDRLSKTGAHEQWIAVEISGTTYKYQVAIAAMRDGASVDRGSAQFSCDCNSEMLLERADWWIARAAESLWDDSAHISGHAGLSGAPQAGLQCAGESPRGAKRPVRYVGLGLVPLGAGALATGIALYLREPYDIRGSYTDTVDTRTTKIPGIALAMAGGIAIGTGLTMFIFDATQRQRQRVAITPSAGSAFTGVNIRGEF